jgi:hypothetical protein
MLTSQPQTPPLPLVRNRDNLIPSLVQEGVITLPHVFVHHIQLLDPQGYLAAKGRGQHRFTCPRGREDWLGRLMRSRGLC